MTRPMTDPIISRDLVTECCSGSSLCGGEPYHSGCERQNCDADRNQDGCHLKHPGLTDER